MSELARPLRRLPTLEPRRRELETCVYCPKLCRSACPVSNAEPNETLIPWGKMSTAYFAARGDVPINSSFAAPAWACTGCHACRGACDHKNDVAGTLLEARAGFRAHGVAPIPSEGVVHRFGARATAYAEGVSTLQAITPSLGPLCMLGCTYVTKLRDIAEDGTRAATKMFGGAALVKECCGLPLLLAGDTRGFVAQAERVAHALGEREVVVLDPGCAATLRTRYPEHGVQLPGVVSLLVEHAAERVTQMHPTSPRAVRYHDPCQLGRGLGVYDAPRAILTRALGAAPGEFVQRREHAACSGAGGLLPIMMPETSREIGRRRVEEHNAEGGGEIVTACASSVLRLRSAGADVSDIATWIARTLG